MMSYTVRMVDISGFLAEPVQRSNKTKSRKDGSKSRPERNALSREKKTTLENPLLTRFPGDNYRSHRETALPPIGHHSGDPWRIARRRSGPLPTKHDPSSNGDSHFPRAIHRTDKQAQLLADIRNLDAHISDELRQLAHSANLVEKIEYLRGVELVRANKVTLENALARGLVEDTPDRKTSGHKRRTRAKRNVSSTKTTGGSSKESSRQAGPSHSMRDGSSTQITDEDQENSRHSRQSRAQIDMYHSQAVDGLSEGRVNSGHSRRSRAQKDVISNQAIGGSSEVYSEKYF